MNKIKIPFMSNKEIVEHYKNIKPIRRFNNHTFLLMELTDEAIIEFSYMWLEDTQDIEVDMDSFLLIKEVQMLHSYSNHEHFQPTIGEVISQIPKKLIKQVVAFEITKHHEIEYFPKEFDAGFHVSTVRLYSKKDVVVTEIQTTYLQAILHQLFTKISTTWYGTNSNNQTTNLNITSKQKNTKIVKRFPMRL